ncbi:NifU family protein [Tunturibacter empetritectus]|uniref:Fe-S cluster biogenesis protein NfuA n=1 Tax=Tunturiibacter lichenicola TaxID=2051959 RepID=A0A852VK93_9BACT|nr:Fe-S cluster biogenesis protein NfuA [Edaphobacter lichenicola]
MAAAPQSETQREVVDSIAPPQRGEFRLQTERVEKLAGRLQSAGDPEIRATALDLVQSVVELHGAALQRLVDSLLKTPAGEQALSEALENDLVSSMLLLHNLHPDDIETRVLRGIEKARPYLKSHGGDVDLAGVRDGIVHLRLHGTCGSCPGSSITLKNAVEDALFEVAPDIVEIVSENAAAPKQSGPQLVTIK